MSRKKTFGVKSKITKRPYLKIMQKITGKLHEQLVEKIGQEYEENINLALQDPSIGKTIKELLKEDKIKLLDDNDMEVYGGQLHGLATTEQEDFDEDASPSKYQQAYDEEESMSPDAKSKTRLVSSII